MYPLNLTNSKNLQDTNLHRYKLPLIGLMIQVAMTQIAIVIVYKQGIIQDLDFPFNSYLPAPPPFGDFLVVHRDWLEGNLGTSGYGRNYFPALYIFIDPLVGLDGYTALMTSLIFSLGILIISMFLCTSDSGKTIQILALLLLVTSYPAAVLAVTGNLELWILALLFAAAASSIRKNWLLFAFFIGTATAFKGFPAVFLMVAVVELGITRKLIKAFLVFAITTLTLTAFALIFLKGGFLTDGIAGIDRAIDATFVSLQLHKDLMWHNIAGMHFGHSLLNSVHAICGGGESCFPTATWAVPVIMIGAIVCFAGAAIATLSKPPLWINWTLPVLVSCIFMPTSTDYKLSYLFIPITLALSASITQRKDMYLFEKVLFCILLLAVSPKPYWRIGQDPFASAQVYGTTTLLLIALAIVVKSFLKHRSSYDLLVTHKLPR